MADIYSRMAKLGLLNPGDRQDAALMSLFQLGGQLANRGAPRLNPTPPPIDLGAAMKTYQQGMSNAMTRNMMTRKLGQESGLREALGNIDVSTMPPGIQPAFKAIAQFNPTAAVSLLGKTLNKAGTKSTAAIRNFTFAQSLKNPKDIQQFLSLAQGNRVINRGNVIEIVDINGNVIGKYPVRLKPGDEPQTHYKQAKKTVLGKAAGEVEAAQTPGTPQYIAAQKKTAQKNLQTIGTIEDAQLVLEHTGDIMTLFDKAEDEGKGHLLTGTLSLAHALTTESYAGQLRSYVASLKSPVVLGAMMKLKKASASGATGFGAMNKPELQLLIDQIGALNPNTTSPKIFKRTIGRIADRYQRVMSRAIRSIDIKAIRKERGIAESVSDDELLSTVLKELDLEGLVKPKTTTSTQSGGNLKPLPEELFNKAQEAIQSGADKTTVIKRLRDNGYDTRGL